MLALKIFHYSRKIGIKLQTGKSSFNPTIIFDIALHQSLSHVKQPEGIFTIILFIFV